MARISETGEAFRTVRGEFVNDVIGELRVLTEANRFKPTPDIDLIWVISGPGTALTPSQDGIYRGEFADRERIDQGFRIFRQITASRLNKPDSEVTMDDMRQHGPLFFYNGEDSTTVGAKYSQNEDLKALITSPESPIPAEKVVIDHIDQASTPPQVVGFAKYLSEHPEFKKVAAVGSADHSVRVSRYIMKYKDLFPSGIRIFNAWIPVNKRVLGRALREVRKTFLYSQKGDMAKDPYKGFPLLFLET